MGDWVVEMPDLSWKNESAPREVIIKDGSTGKVRGRINVSVPDDSAYGQMTGAFCGPTEQSVLATGHAVATYSIPSGALLASFPADTWRDPSARHHNRASVACSPTAKRVAILSGTRLTLHDLKASLAYTYGVNGEHLFNLQNSYGALQRHRVSSFTC